MSVDAIRAVERGLRQAGHLDVVAGLDLRRTGDQQPSPRGRFGRTLQPGGGECFDRFGAAQRADAEGAQRRAAAGGGLIRRRILAQPVPRIAALIARRALAGDLHRRRVGRPFAQREIEDVDAVGDAGRRLGVGRRILHLQRAVRGNAHDVSAQGRESSDVPIQADAVVDDEPRQRRRVARQLAREAELGGQRLDDGSRILLLEAAIEPRLRQLARTVRRRHEPQAVRALVNAVDLAREDRRVGAIAARQRHGALVGNRHRRRCRHRRNQQLEDVHVRRHRTSQPQRQQMLAPRDRQARRPAGSRRRRRCRRSRTTKTRTAPNDTVAAGRLTVGRTARAAVEEGKRRHHAFSDSYQVRLMRAALAAHLAEHERNADGAGAARRGRRHHPAARVHHHVDVQMTVEALAGVVGVHDHVALVHHRPECRSGRRRDRGSRTRR